MTQPKRTLAVSQGRTSALPTADRLARGDLNRYLYGRKMPHKLTPREWSTYEAAKATGFLAIPSAGITRVRLRTYYWDYCADLGRPFVVLELRQRYAAVEMDLIDIPAWPDELVLSWQLSDQAFKQIDALLGEHTRPGAWWSSGHEFVYSSAIPIAVVPWLAGRLFAIACADLRGAQ